MQMTCETVKVKNPHDGGEMIINKSTFDKGGYELFDKPKAKAKKAPAKKKPAAKKAK